MRYAVISDIHSNLESLRKLVAFLPKLRIDKIVCLGDLVGYNANPNECVEIISKLGNIELIRGNHDRAVSSKHYEEFSKNASEVVRWTIIQMKKDNGDFLAGMRQGPGSVDGIFGICHGSVINEDRYILSPFAAKTDFDWMSSKGINLLFFGHTHQQTAYHCRKEAVKEIDQKEIDIRPGDLYIINPGSVGQPRDGDPRASFAVYDADRGTVSILRYEYDIKTAQRKIIDNGLPDFLAERLEYGR